MEILPDRPELQTFPYLALVTRTDPATGNVTNTCAGALVENGWRVLTARQVRHSGLQRARLHGGSVL